MEFEQWINQVGPTKVAALVDVSMDTVYQWRRGETSPKVMTAHKLIELSHGVLSWEIIYTHYVNIRLAESNPNQTKLKL